MKKHLKKLSCLLAFGLIGATCACVAPSSKKEETPNYTASSYDFSTIMVDRSAKTLKAYDEDHPQANGTVVYDVYTNVKEKSYLKLTLETNVNLVGYINYRNNADATVTNSEKFYVEAGSTEFTTFLDSFRRGARGSFDKTITTISIQNVSPVDGNFTLNTVEISDRSIELFEDWKITNGFTVLGTSPFYGGCITYLEKLDEDIYEYMDADGNICIDRDVDPDSVQAVVSDKVNLINIYDLGREIQPSYYSNVGKANGYDPDYDPEDKDSYYPGLTITGGPIYNPIQCGDFGGHTPQIVDYTWKKDYLYVKMKGQEWFFYTNIQANGYIEVTYSFDATGAVIIDNRYTDFSQFTNVYDVPICTQETPATYFVYPLDYFYCETKQGTIFDRNIAPQNGTATEKESLKSNVNGEYFYTLKGKMVSKGWCAFVNENKFGVGIYMPNADRYVASRGNKSVNYYGEKDNRTYHPTYFNFAEDQLVPSYSVLNYGYINPGLTRRMIDFVPLEYSYALFVGDTDQMGEAFGELKSEGRLTNAHLANEETMGWPKY